MTLSSKTSRRRLSPELRRAEITQVASALLAEKGYWGLTMADVAKSAGLTVQGVLHYFSSKDELMLDVLARRDEADYRLMVPSDHQVRDIHEFLQIIGKLVNLNGQRRELIQLYTVLAAESLSPTHPAHEFFNNRFVLGVQSFAALAYSWHENPEQLGLEMLCALDGLQINWLRDPSLNLETMWKGWASTYFAGRLA